jgi:hypothetical protein
MTFEEKVIQVILSVASVKKDYPADRVCFDDAPNDDGSPFIVCNIITVQKQNSLDEGVAGSKVNQKNIQLQVTVYSASRGAAKAHAQAIELAMDRATTFSACLVDQQPDSDGAADLKGELLTFSCWHSQDISA